MGLRDDRVGCSHASVIKGRWIGGIPFLSFSDLSPWCSLSVSRFGPQDFFPDLGRETSTHRSRVLLFFFGGIGIRLIYPHLPVSDELLAQLSDAPILSLRSFRAFGLFLEKVGNGNGPSEGDR